MPTVTHMLQEAGSKLRITIEGDILSTTVEGLKTEVLAKFDLMDVRSAKWSLLILDITSAQMVDSLGLNLILTIAKKAQLCSAEMKTIISKQAVYRTFLATRMDRLMQIEVLEPKPI